MLKADSLSLLEDLEPVHCAVSLSHLNVGDGAGPHMRLNATTYVPSICPCEASTLCQAVLQACKLWYTLDM